MTVEIKKELELPQDVLNEAAKNLFNSAFEKLRENKGFQKTLVEKFLEGENYNYRPDRVKFDSQGTVYSLSLNRQVESDTLVMDTVNEGVEEEIFIWLIYNDEHDGDCSLGQSKRGVMVRSTVRYTRRDLDTYSLTESYRNSSKATEKVREFLHRI